MLQPRQSGDDAGAILVMTAILVVLVFAFAAVAVDLGDSFARRRQVQSQADMAALAGAALLDGTSASAAPAIAEAASYLTRNLVMGDAFDAGQLSDADMSNGEIQVTDGYTRIRVTAPPATVAYGLARVIGHASAQVQAVAVAGIYTPGKLAPFFIADGCIVPGGSILQLKTDPGNVTPTPITPAWFPSPSSPGGTWPALTGAPTPLELFANAAGQQITFRGSALAGTAEIAFIWGETADDRVTVTSGFTVTPGAKKKDPDLVTVTVPDAVVTLPEATFAQERVVFLQVRPSGSTTQWSVPNAEASFTIPLPGADIPDECGEKSTGDFGLVDSPRAGTKNLDASQRNVALGLDHPVLPYPGGSTALTQQGIPAGETDGATWNDICVKYTASPPLVLDVTGAVGPNCLEIYTGNKSPVLEAGLIEGGTGPDYAGRLDAPASAACPRSLRTVVTHGTWTINDDLLSCYIRGNLTVSQVLSVGAHDVLSPTIVDSPRFLLVPVIHAEYPPANGSYPIVGFRGAMISAERADSRRMAPKPEPDNGVIISNKSVGAMTVTYFDLDAMPDVLSSTGTVIDYIGTGPRVVRLIG